MSKSKDKFFAYKQEFADRTREEKNILSFLSDFDILISHYSVNYFLTTHLNVMSDKNDQGSKYTRIRVIAYWIPTLIVAWEMVAGSIWDILQIEYVRVVFNHLHYPLYVLYIIGVWKLPCAVALLVPGFLRIKEWAYAGASFNYFGATASHLLVGDGPDKWAGPLIFLAFTLASYFLRPSHRGLPNAKPLVSSKPINWIIPIGIIIGFLVVTLLTLPKGPPPGTGW